jgi:hypothetical protein
VEEDLDTYWTAADVFCKNLAGKGSPDLLAHDITRGRSLRRTTPWINMAPERHEGVHPKHMYMPLLSDTSRDVDVSSDEHIKPLPLTKEKFKTRGTTHLERVEADDCTANIQPAEASEEYLRPCSSLPLREMYQVRSLGMTSFMPWCREALKQKSFTVPHGDSDLQPEAQRARYSSMLHTVH